MSGWEQMRIGGHLATSCWVPKAGWNWLRIVQSEDGSFKVYYFGGQLFDKLFETLEEAIQAADTWAIEAALSDGGQDEQA